MATLPVVSGKQAIAAFQKAGWQVARGGKSHVVLTKDAERNNISVPLHDELDRGTLRSIIRKAGLTVDEFTKLL
jgi:predicted RNA binding protein YcfA (HicA-like mRNA interferase family)